MTKTEMPQLAGSPKQIAWADKIRAGLDAVLDANLARYDNDIADGFRQVLHAVAARQTTARWWIDNREYIWLGLREGRTDADQAEIKRLESLARARRAAKTAAREITARELAAELGVSLATVYRRCRSGAVTATKNSAGRWVITVPAT
jgi:DNA invertase Pin-like site-specific DNA recombinase